MPSCSMSLGYMLIGVKPGNHSQFDNDEYYNADVFQFHHELYGLLVMAFDRVKVAPVNVGRTLQALQESVRPVTGREDEKGIRILLERTAEAKKIADAVYKRVKEINEISRREKAAGRISTIQQHRSPEQ